MSLEPSARITGHDPHPYVKDVMERLSTQRVTKSHGLEGVDQSQEIVTAHDC